MTDQTSDDFASRTYIFYVLGWILFVGLLLNGAKGMSDELVTLNTQTMSWVDIFNGVWRALLLNLPTFLLAWAVWDLTHFFGRCGEGEVFTHRNVKTLKVSAESLFWAALVSAVIAPTVISWINREVRGILFDSSDLAFGVAAIGIALYGFAGVLSQAVSLKEENDEMV